MNDKITIERLPDETPRAYQARVEYIVAGPQRSLERLRQQIGNRSVRYLEVWSSRYDWQEHARRYDETVYTLATQEAVDEYRASLIDYRKRYGDMGKALYGSAAKLLRKINTVLDSADAVGPSYLGTVVSAAKTAADLEALALRVEHLLGKLSEDAEPGTE